MLKRNNFLYILLVTLVFILAFVLRFYQLGVVPAGLQQDESSIGYNAYSILKTGKDEYGVSYPLYFKAFGEYKLPLYIYSAVPSIAIFGVNEFAVRFPSALSGSLTVIVFYLVLKELVKKDKKIIPLLGALLLSINPWHLHFSRGAFEVTLALFFITTGFYLFLKSLSHKRDVLLIISLLLFAASVYTYNIARIFSPVFVFFLFIYYRKDLKQKNTVIQILSIAISLLVLVPFMITVFAKGGYSSAQGQIIFSSKMIEASMLELRSNLGEMHPLLVKLFYNKIVLILWQYVNNILSYLSVQFFFLTGSGHGNHGVGNVGQFYIFELPLMIIGLYLILKEKLKWGYIFIVWFILVVLTASLTREVPQATRSFFLIIPMVSFSALGLYGAVKLIESYKKLYVVIFVRSFIGIIVVYNIIFYFNSYYQRFPAFYSKPWRQQDKAVTNYLQQNENKYNKIIFDTKSDFLYSSYLFYSAYPPEEFHRTVKRAPDDKEGFSKVLSFGKFEYKDVDWTKDYKEPNNLIVTLPQQKPDEYPPLISFYFPKKFVVLSVKEEIAQYPIEEIAYTLVETNKK